MMKTLLSVSTPTTPFTASCSKVALILSQGVEDYYQPDFDFASQVKLPICLYVKNKNIKAVERFIGTAKSSHKLEKALDGLEKGMGVLNLDDPILLRAQQFWERK